MNISFALTTRQFRAQTKDVTRRLGWERVMANIGCVEAPTLELAICLFAKNLRGGENL